MQTNWTKLQQNNFDNGILKDKNYNFMRWNVLGAGYAEASYTKLIFSFAFEKIVKICS